MMNIAIRERRQRIRAVAILTTLGTPSYAFCCLGHVCRGGHMQHGPYPAASWINDLLWTTCFVAVAVFAPSLRTKGGVLFLSGSIVLICSRILLGSLGGTGLLIELPLSIAMNVCAIYYLVRAHTFVVEEEVALAEALQQPRTRMSLCLIGLLILAALAIWQYFNW